MGTLEFKVCRVTTNSKETKYKDYKVELNEIASIHLDGEKKQCSMKMKDGTSVEIQYFDSNIVI